MKMMNKKKGKARMRGMKTMSKVVIKMKINRRIALRIQTVQIQYKKNICLNKVKNSRLESKAVNN